MIVSNPCVYMAKYINPFSDWGFKTIFGQTANKDLLIDFLNNLLTGDRKSRTSRSSTRNSEAKYSATGA